MTTGIETDVTLSPEPVQVPDGPDGATAVVVQLFQCRVLVLRGEDPPGHVDETTRIRRYCVTPAIRRSTKRTKRGAGRNSGSVISSGSTSSTTRPPVSSEQHPEARTFFTHCASDPYVRKK